MGGTQRIRAWSGRIALALVAIALALPALTPPSTASTDTNVSIVYRAYQPSDLTVVAGQTVIWTNSGLGPHTVTSDAALFDSGRLEAGATFSYTFTAPGTYLYSCTVHPTMHGRVVVLAELPQVVQVHLSKQHGAHGDLTLVHVQAPRPGAKALLQLRSGSTWSTSRRAQLGSTGRITFALSRSVHRRLRVVVQGPGVEPRLISRALKPRP
jgi:plastocyanin